MRLRQINEDQIHDNIVYNLLSKINSIFKIDSDIVLFKKQEMTKSFGFTAFMVKNNKFQFELNLSSYLFKEGLEPYLLNTVAHEMCHYFALKEAISNGYYSIQDGNEQPVNNFPNQQLFLDYNDERGQGHGIVFFKYAKVLNDKLNLSIPISSHVTTEEMEMLYRQNNYNFALYITCSNCGLVDAYLTLPTPYDFGGNLKLAAKAFMSFMTIDAANSSDTNKAICPQCNKGELKIYFKNESDRQEIVLATLELFKYLLN